MAFVNADTWAAILRHEDTALAVGADAKDIVEFESAFRVRLPESYKEFLLRANGGEIGLARIFGINRGDYLDLAKLLSDMGTYIQNMAVTRVLPFANDWGGSYFCFDLSGSSDDDRVLYWNHEYSEEPADRPLLWTPYSRDFVEFITKVIS